MSGEANLTVDSNTQVDPVPQLVGCLRHVQQQLSSLEEEIQDMVQRQQKMEDTVNETRGLIQQFLIVNCRLVEVTETRPDTTKGTTALSGAENRR